MPTVIKNDLNKKILSITLSVLSVIHLIVSTVQLFKCNDCMKTVNGINPFGKGPWLLSFIVMLIISILSIWNVIHVFNPESLEDIPIKINTNKPIIVTPK